MFRRAPGEALEALDSSKVALEGVAAADVHDFTEEDASSRLLVHFIEEVRLEMGESESPHDWCFDVGKPG